MRKTGKRGRALTAEAAQEMGKARWEGVTAEERRALMSAAGKLGGRPRSDGARCPCGAHTLKRAMARGFDCCRKQAKVVRRALLAQAER